MDVKTALSGISAGALAVAMALPSAHAAQHESEMKGSQAPGATGAQSQPMQDTQAGAEQRFGGIQASRLIGSELKNEQGETLGTIEEVVLNRFGEVSYVALKPAEGIEIQGEYIAVPWHAMTAGADRNLVLPMRKEQLAQAPGLDSEKSPTGEQGELRAALDRYYLVVAIPALQEVSFSELDTDGNQLIDRREAMQADVLAQHFPAVDEDGSGTISTAEFSAFEQEIEQLREQGPDAQGQQQMEQQNQQPESGQSR